ncbi:MAG: type II toxin-antitoxin system HicA family toxin [Candidatus Methanoperedens sp.]|nr:type II toxin-antitoxin system HicA family toxin [Candidatus Methanoperedens sp.]
MKVPKLPVVSGNEAVKALSKAGFYIHHQKGSHIVLKKDGAPDMRVVVPNHKEIKRGMLRSIIRDAGLTVDEFVFLLA